MSFGTPVVPPESWKMHGSVGSMAKPPSALLGKVAGRSISSVSDSSPGPAVPSTMRNLRQGLASATRAIIGPKTKSLWRSG